MDAQPDGVGVLLDIRFDDRLGRLVEAGVDRGPLGMSRNTVDKLLKLDEPPVFARKDTLTRKEELAIQRLSANSAVPFASGRAPEPTGFSLIAEGGGPS